MCLPVYYAYVSVSTLKDCCRRYSKEDIMHYVSKTKYSIGAAQKINNINQRDSIFSNANGIRDLLGSRKMFLPELSFLFCYKLLRYYYYFYNTVDSVEQNHIT